MKILLLHDVDAGKQNGVSVSLGILTRELEKSGYDIRVLTLADGTKSFKDGNLFIRASGCGRRYATGISMSLLRGIPISFIPIASFPPF